MNKKMAKTINWLTTSCSVGLLFVQVSYARIVGVPVITAKSTKGKNVSASQRKNGPEQIIDHPDNPSDVCSKPPELKDATYFPLSFFQGIARDGSLPTVDATPGGDVTVTMPAMLDVCGKFRPDFYQDPVTKNVTIFMQLEDKQTYGHYVECLQNDKSIVTDADGKILHANIDGQKYVAEQPHNFHFDFSKEDIKKSIKLSFGYPSAFKSDRTNDGYEPSFSTDPSVHLPSSLCMEAEQVNGDGIKYLNEGQDVLLARLKGICDTGQAQKIAEARKSIGNADALKDIADKIKSEIDAGYLVAVQTDVDKISNQMQKIEDRLSRDKDSMDEPTAKKLTKEYADLAKQLNHDFLDPAIYRIDTLMKQDKEMDDKNVDADDPKRKAINDDIKKLNERIGAFAGRKEVFAPLYSVMEKYSLSDAAKTIEDIRLKSYWYGSVYPGSQRDGDKRGKPISADEANKKQYDGLQKFEKVLADWSDQYQVGKGNQAPIQKTEKERASAYDRMNKNWYDYQLNEQKKLQEYCGVGMLGSVKNPVQCKAFQANAQKRMDAALKKRKKDLLYIQGRNTKLGKMGANYNEYQKHQAEKASNSDYEPYGSSYTSYEDNFSDRFPGYYGDQTYTQYDPSLYSMGTQPGAMVGGNAGMYPQTVNPQMQIPQGQYQMPQMGGYQAGGWPNI